MLPAKAIKCGILGIVGQEGVSIEYGIAWCSSYFDEMCEWLMRGNEIARPWVFFLSPWMSRWVASIAEGLEWAIGVSIFDRRNVSNLCQRLWGAWLI